MQLHIKGIISEAQVVRLKIGEAYLLSGSLQRQGKRADVKFIKLADGNNYHLGSYTFLITGFKSVK
jgi:hypothetical protein